MTDHKLGHGFAGFWERFAAYLLDTVILGAVTYLISLIFLPLDFLTGFYPEILGIVSASIDVVRFLLSVIVPWLYFAFMESSKRQATLGKIAIGLKVTDLNGKKLTFSRATGRFFSKFLSVLTLMIGYVIAAFTEKRQALHDMIAGTFVIRGRS